MGEKIDTAQGVLIASNDDSLAYEVVFGDKEEQREEIEGGEKTDTIQIFNKEGIYLFSIERKDRTETKLSTEELYGISGIQWFESGAENYHKLIDVNPDLKDKEKCEGLGVLYFTWREVVEFADSMAPNIDFSDKNKDEKLINYATIYFGGKKGDWKKAENGAKGYRLVSMEGIPYWADAVGQLPYAINIYRGFLQLTHNKAKAKNATINMGYAFHRGREEGITIAYNKQWISREIGFLTEEIPAFLGVKDIANIYFLDNVYDYDEDIIKEFEPNSYDNKMILRGINYGINPYSDLSLDSDGMNVK